MEKIYQIFKKNVDGSYNVLDIKEGKTKDVSIIEASKGTFSIENKNYGESIKGVIPETYKASGFYCGDRMPYFYEGNDGLLHLPENVIRSSVTIADFVERTYFVTEVK